MRKPKLMWIYNVDVWPQREAPPAAEGRFSLFPNKYYAGKRSNQYLSLRYPLAFGQKCELKLLLL